MKRIRLTRVQTMEDYRPVPLLLGARRRRTRVRFFLCFWLFILSAIAFLDRTNVSVAALQIEAEFGLGDQHLGWVFSAFLVGYAIFQLPAGILAVRFGPRRVLTFGILVWSAATALTALLPTGISAALLFLIIVRFALGMGESVICPASNQFISRWVPQDELGRINGLILAGVGVGSGLTPPLLTWIIVEHGWRAAFWFSAMIGVIGSAVWWMFARDTPGEHPGVSRAERLEISEGGANPSPDIQTACLKQSRDIPWRLLFSRADLKLLMVGYFCFGYVAWVFFSWFFLYLAKVRGLDLKASAYCTMLPFVCMTICSLIGGALSDQLTRTISLRVGRCMLASCSLFLTALFLVLGSRTRDPEFAAVLLAFGAGSLYLSQSSFWSVSVDIAGRTSGVFASLVNMSGQIGGAITASLTPWLAERFGWTMPFSVAAALGLIGAAAWLLIHPERALEASSASRLERTSAGTTLIGNSHAQ